MVQETIEVLIARKEVCYEKITALEVELVEANARVKNETARYWLTTNWEDVIDTKITDKTKKAYVDAQVRPFVDKQETLTNEINSLYREVDIINDKMAYGVYDDRLE